MPTSHSTRSRRSAGKPTTRRKSRSHPATSADVDADELPETSPETIETIESIVFARPAHPLVPRLPKPATTPAARLAARNLMDALGGPQVLAGLLQLAGDVKASRLSELLTSAEYGDEEKFSLAWKMQQAGMKGGIAELTELLLDVRNARVLARLVTSGDEVAEAIVSRATDQIIEHRACLASGRVLAELEDGTTVPTDVECFECQGSGYVCKSAEKEWVDLYLELVKLRKNQMVIDNRRQMMLNQQNVNVFGDLQSADGAPSLDAIIKRADEQRIALPVARQIGDGQDRVPVMAEMPEDEAGDGDEDAVDAV